MMSRAALEAAQLSKLHKLIAALETNPFYRGRIPVVHSLAEFSALAPFTRKPELVEDQQAHPPFGTNLTYGVERYTRLSQTSSTTGTLDDLIQPIRRQRQAATADSTRVRPPDGVR